MLLVVVSHRQVQYKASNLSLKICHFHRIFAPFVMTVALFDRKLHLIWIILNTVPNIKRQYWRFERKNSKLCACHLTDFFGRDKLISRIGKFTTSCIVYCYLLLYLFLNIVLAVVWDDFVVWYQNNNVLNYNNGILKFLPINKSTMCTLYVFIDIFVIDHLNKPVRSWFLQIDKFAALVWMHRNIQSFLWNNAVIWRIVQERRYVLG